MDATLHQAAVEQALVHDGWMLENFTTDRRSHADADDHEIGREAFASVEALAAFVDGRLAARGADA